MSGAYWPTTLLTNAWMGDAPVTAPGSRVSIRARAWTLRSQQPIVQHFLRVPPPLDLTDWRNPRVGWGLVLVERDDMTPAQLASADDAPEPIQALVKARGNAPVFRYRPGSPNRFAFLRNYATSRDVPISGSPRGLAADALPHYLLIYGSPAEIPWQLQYTLNTTCAVGRLDLQGIALEHYIQALLTEWCDARSQIDQAVMWAVDHDPNDISHLMRDAIAASVFTDWQGDTTLRANALFLDGSQQQASGAALQTALVERRPALVVTTSHGQTGPLSDKALMRAYLGVPVAQDFQALDIAQLLSHWQPDGAIWYAHACCSAGGDASSSYGCIGQANSALCLIEAGSPIDQVLQGVASLGSQVAPLPTALLGASRPLRAFIGHVEPTFDWTIRQPETGQYLTSPIRQIFYNNIYQPQPVGLALRPFYASLATLYSEHEAAFRAYSQGEDTIGTLLYTQLAARDIQNMVLLGDPTATLPQLP